MFCSTLRSGGLRSAPISTRVAAVGRHVAPAVRASTRGRRTGCHCNHRQTTLVASALAAGWRRVRKAGAGAPPPPEVYVAAVVQKDVPVYLELVGQTAGLPGRRDPRARRGLPRDGELPRGLVRHARATLLYQIDPQAARGGARRGEGRPGRRREARARQGRTTTSPATRRSSRSRRSASRSSTTRVAAQDAARVAGGRRDGRRRQGDARSRLHARSRRRSTGWSAPRRSKPGNLVGRGESTLLTTVSQIDPILFRVGITEAEYLRVAKRDPERGRRGSRKPPGIELTLADGTVHPAHGHVDAIERAVDADDRHPRRPVRTSRTRQTSLRPGQYGRARVLARDQGRRAARAAARRAGAAEPLQRRGRRRATARSRSATSRSVRASTRSG